MSSANGISNGGQIVGQSTDSSGDYLGFVYNAGKMQSTGTYGGGSSGDAFGVNSSGQVAGAVTDSNGQSHAMISSNGVEQILNGFVGGINSYAMAININGEVAGYAENALGSTHPAVWRSGVMTDLGTLGGWSGMAEGINDSGAVVGYSYLAGNAQTHAFYFNGTMNDIGTLGGTSSYAYSVNNSDVVVGWSYTSGNAARHAFYWNGAMHDLGVLSSYSYAYDVNNAGQVVGTSGGAAFLWQNGTMTNLNTLLPTGSGWQLEYANSINDQGQIVGWGILNGNQHAYLLSPQTTQQQPPAAPTNLSASATTGQVSLRWTGSSGATSYNLYRATTSGREALFHSGLTAAAYTDTGLTGGTTYYYKVAAVGGGGTSALSNEAFATPPVTAGSGGGSGGTNGTQTVQINCGGGASGSFGGDRAFSGGTAWSTTAAISTAGVANAAPASVYQTQRYGNVSYTIGSLTPGASYTVRLHFAESWFGPGMPGGGGKGSRVFNVAINGAAALTNFDAYATAGGSNKAVVEPFNVTANSSGAITIAFTSVVSNAMVEGIEVVPPGGASGAGTGSGSGTGGGQAPGTVMKQINAGGGAAGSFGGDTAFSGGTPWSTTASISTSGVANAAPMAVYQTQRYGNFSYSLGGLTPGASYTVRLHFAESWFGAGMPGGGGKGSRVFNVTVNGQAALTNFDVYATAGGSNKALVEPITATASSAGVITVQFTSVVTNAEVNGLEVIAN